MYKVVEIFDSIEGEGLRSGFPATFIRFAGCNMRCSYCDTSYALFGEIPPCTFKEMSQEQIVQNIHFKRVTLTGGEPLIQKDIKQLILTLENMGIETNVETNGSVDTSEYRTCHTFFTIDYKLPSSQTERYMSLSRFYDLTPKDVIKFVIGDEKDLQRGLSVIADIQRHYTPNQMPNIYLGAVAEKYSPRSIVDAMLKYPELCDARLQVQLHKVVNVQ